MKTIKSVSVFVLILFGQIVFAQNNEIVKSFYLQANQFVEKGLNSTNVSKVLKNQFKIPEYYVFQRQVIKGTKDKMSEKDELGYEHERYAQFYKGIKIEHSDIRVHYLNGLFVSANGEYIDAQNIDVSIMLSKENAIQKATEYIGAKEYMWKNEAENNWLKSITNDETASLFPKPEIIICKNSIDLRDTTFHVAYKVDIFAKEPLRHDYVYVDATAGSILAVVPILVNANGTAQTRYSGTRTILTQQNGTTYRLRGYNNNLNIETYNMQRGTSFANASDFTDNDNNWTATEFHNTNKDDAALDAHWGTMMTYGYFSNVHGRNSYDNNGGTLRNYVHYGTNFENAGWDRQYHYMVYGDGETVFDAVTALDVIAHEIGHGVCQFSAGLVYSGESGAINESLSDIWGACVENWATTNKNTWLIGEDITLQTTALRSMSNPNAFRQPDTYGGSNWVNTNGCAPTPYNDYCGVHTNNSVMNYWFYLLSVGGNGTNDIGNDYNVTGIGIDKAAKIVYYAETAYMITNTNFALARIFTILAAVELYGDCSLEVGNVTNAWYAVGVGDQYGVTPVNFVNQIVTTDTTITSCGDINVQNVKVQNGAKLTLDAEGEVNIGVGFEVELGSEFEIVN